MNRLAKIRAEKIAESLIRQHIKNKGYFDFKMLKPYFERICFNQHYSYSFVKRVFFQKIYSDRNFVIEYEI